jgi:hypothetical protein
MQSLQDHLMLHSFQNIFLLTYFLEIIIHDGGQLCELAILAI